MSEHTEFEERIRSVERVLEVGLERAQESPPHANLIPSDIRKSILEQRYGGAQPDFASVPYSQQYTRCFTFLSTVCSSLAAKQNGDITDDQYEVLQRVYRFVTGPLRAAIAGIKPNSDREISEIEIDRLTTEMHHLASRVRDVDLLAQEHTYS